MGLKRCWQVIELIKGKKENVPLFIWAYAYQNFVYSPFFSKYCCLEYVVCLRPCGIWLVLFSVIHLLLADTQYCFTFRSCFFLSSLAGSRLHISSVQPLWRGRGSQNSRPPGHSTPDNYLEKDSWCFGSDKLFRFSLVRVALRGLSNFFYRYMGHNREEGLQAAVYAGRGGGYSRTFWVEMCHWDHGTLSLYQSYFSWILLPYTHQIPPYPIAAFRLSCTNLNLSIWFFLSGNSRFLYSRLKYSINWSVLWKMFILF